MFYFWWHVLKVLFYLNFVSSQMVLDKLGHKEELFLYAVLDLLEIYDYCMS